MAAAILASGLMAKGERNADALEEGLRMAEKLSDMCEPKAVQAEEGKPE